MHGLITYITVLCFRITMYCPCLRLKRRSSLSQTTSGSSIGSKCSTTKLYVVTNVDFKSHQLDLK